MNLRMKISQWRKAGSNVTSKENNKQKKEITVRKDMGTKKEMTQRWRKRITQGTKRGKV